MISESTPIGTKVWSGQYGFGFVVAKSPQFKEDNCFIVQFDDDNLLMPRKNLTEVESEGHD